MIAEEYQLDLAINNNPNACNIKETLNSTLSICMS